MSKSKDIGKKSQQLNIYPQLELPQMSLMSLLQFGSQTLLVEAIKAEITEQLGRRFYQHCESNQEQVYTADDRMELMLEEYNSKHPDQPVTKEEFKAMMVEAFEKQVINKNPKQNRIFESDVSK